MKKSGGAFLLQQMEPKRLLGSLVSDTEESELGWIHLSFFPEADLLTLQKHDDQLSLILDRTVALSLIAFLQILIVQNRILRGELGRQGEPAATLGERQAVRVDTQGRSLLVCSWGTGTAGIEYQSKGDQIELQLREELAAELAARLIDRLARVAATGVV